MPMPKIDGPNRKKPLCYDPKREKFIYFDDIVSGREKIIPVETLTPRDLKKLILERHRSGPDYKVQAITGFPLSRDDVVRAIDKDEAFGRDTIEAEKSYLSGLLAEIKKNLKKQ
jgi:hypothetical protein